MGRILLAVLALCFCFASPTLASPIDSVSYFTSRPHTLINFESDGAGRPVIIYNGESKEMLANEYASLGVIFSRIMHWVNDQGKASDAAQMIGGSPTISFGEPGDDDFVMSSTVPVTAFGLWVMDNKNYRPEPLFTAFNRNGAVIESVTFDSFFIDGTIEPIQYGFLGIASDQQIGSVHIVKHATGFDDLRFVVVPEPSALLALLTGFGVLALRRRR